MLFGFEKINEALNTNACSLSLQTPFQIHLITYATIKYANLYIKMDDSFDEIINNAKPSQAESAPMDTTDQGVIASLSRDAATTTPVAEAASGGSTETPDHAGNRRPPSPISWDEVVQTQRAAEEKKERYRLAKEKEEEKEEEKEKEEEEEPAVRPKTTMPKKKSAKQASSSDEEKRGARTWKKKSSKPGIKKPAFFQKQRMTAEEKRKDDEQWAEERRTGKFKQSAAPRDYSENVPRVVDSGETTPARPDVAPTPSSSTTPLPIEQQPIAPEMTPENMDTSAQPPQAPRKYKIKPIVFDADSQRMPPPATPAPPTASTTTSKDEKELEKLRLKEEEKARLQTPFRLDYNVWVPEEHDGQPFRMVAERNLQTEMTAAGSSRRTEIRLHSHRSGLQPEIGDDWQRDPDNNVLGAAERLGVRIVDQSQQTYEERHQANRLATGKYIKRKRGKKNIANSEKKRRRWETKRDLEAQKNNLRQATTPSAAEDAEDRIEQMSSGYATPEEEIAPTIQRPAPPSPSTEFGISRLTREISPSRIQIVVHNEEEGRRENASEDRPERWLLSNEHGQRWPYRVLPEREDPKPSDGVQRQREKIQHLMTPTAQLRIAEERYRHFRKDEKDVDFGVQIDPVDLIDFLHRYFGIGHPDEDRAMAVSGFLSRYGSDPKAILEKQKWAKIAQNVHKITKKNDEWNKISDKEREKEIKRQKDQAADKKKKLERIMASKEADSQQQQQQQEEDAEKLQSLEQVFSQLVQWYPPPQPQRPQQQQRQQQQPQQQQQMEHQPSTSRERLPSVASRGSSKASKKDSTETISSEWSGPEYERASKKGKKLQKRRSKREERKESSSEEEEEEEKKKGTERALEQAQDFAHENRTGDDLLDTLKAAGMFEQMFDLFKRKTKEEKEERRRKERRRRHSSSSDESSYSRSSKRKSKKGHRSKHHH